MTLDLTHFTTFSPQNVYKAAWKNDYSGMHLREFPATYSLWEFQLYPTEVPVKASKPHRENYSEFPLILSRRQYKYCIAFLLIFLPNYPLSYIAWGHHNGVGGLFWLTQHFFLKKYSKSSLKWQIFGHFAWRLSFLSDMSHVSQVVIWILQGVP